MGKTATKNGLRADAARNLERILTAGREAFAEHGLDVPLEDIALRAGVGIATLYRRFPNREELVTACLGPVLDAYIVAADEALDHEDPWQGFCSYVHRMCALQASDIAFSQIVTLTYAETPELQQKWQVSFDKARRVVDRAIESGALREDFMYGDLVLVFMANAGVVGGTKPYAPGEWERFVGYMLGAFRAPSPLPASTFDIDSIEAMADEIGLRISTGGEA